MSDLVWPGKDVEAENARAELSRRGGSGRSLPLPPRTPTGSMTQLFDSIKWDLWRANKAAHKLSNGIDDAKFEKLRTLIKQASTLNGELRSKYEVWEEPWPEGVYTEPPKDWKEEQ